jgi:hypothetical protein
LPPPEPPTSPLPLPPLPLPPPGDPLLGEQPASAPVTITASIDMRQLDAWRAKSGFISTPE